MLSCNDMDIVIMLYNVSDGLYELYPTSALTADMITYLICDIFFDVSIVKYVVPCHGVWK